MHIKSISIVALIGVIGAMMFDALGLPVPWMLGSLFAVLISQFFIKVELFWPVQFRNIGLIVIGVAIGQTFQLSIFSGMGWLLFLMFSINLFLVIVSIAMAFGVHKICNVSLKTALTCTVPGGLGQIVVFAEEERDINLAVVTYFHVVRVVSIVMVIPFILSGHVVQSGNTDSLLGKELLPLILLLLVAGGTVWIGKKIRLPVPYFLTPILLIMTLTLLSVETPKIPGDILHLAQLLMGTYIGLLLKPNMIKLGSKIIVLGILSALFLIAITFGQGFLLVHFLGYSLSTSFLSTAAGGLDQMSLLATAIGADVSVVTVFQVFRLLFVFLLVLPLLKIACTYLDNRQVKELHRNQKVLP